MDQAQAVAALQQMLNPDANTRKPAEEFLRANEQTVGFCSCMLEASSSAGQEPQLRQLAAIYLKNNIVRNWAPKNQESPGLTPEEKAHIRRRALELIQDEDDGVAVQKAIAISKISRADYPASWPELFPTLGTLLQGAPPQQLLRVLSVLHLVLKELSSKCLLADRKTFQGLAPSLMGFVQTQWATCASQAAAESTASQEALQGLVLSSKVLRRILLFGFTQLFAVPEALALIQAAFESLQQVAAVHRLAIQSRGPQDSSSLLLGRGVHHVGKLLCEVWKKHPLAFAAQLAGYLQFAVESIADKTQPELATIAQTMITVCLESPSYRARASLRAPRPEATQATATLQQLMDGECVRRLLQVLVTQLLALTPADLAGWEEDPEGLVLGTGDSDCHSHARSVAVAERLAKALLLWGSSHPELGLDRMLLESFAGCGPPGGSTPEGCALKEGCVHVLGMGLPELQESLQLEQWFRTHLIAELQQPPEGCAGAQRYLHRRVVWLLGQGGNGLSAELRSSLVSTVGTAVPQMHEVVRLTAAVGFITIVEDAQEDEELMAASSLQVVASVLLQLVQGIESDDMRLRLLRCLTSMQHKCHDQPVQHAIAQGVLATTPSLVAALHSESQLAAAAVDMLRPAVACCGHDPNALLAVLPVLELALLGEGGSDQLTLQEGGVELLRAVLQFAPAADGLGERFGGVLVGLLASKHLRGQVLHTLEPLVVLGGRGFLGRHGAALVAAVEGLLPTLQKSDEREVRAVAQLFDAIVCSAPAEAPSLLFNIGRALAQVVASNTCGDFTVVEAVVALARMALVNSEALLQVLQPDETLGAVLAVWLDRSDCILTPERRKLCALALCALMCSGNMAVLQQSNQVLDVWVSVIVGDDFAAERKHNPNLLETRRRQLQEQTGAAVELRGAVLQCLQQLQASLGDQRFGQLIQTVDPAVMAQLHSATSGSPSS